MDIRRLFLTPTTRKPTQQELIDLTNELSQASDHRHHRPIPPPQQLENRMTDKTKHCPAACIPIYRLALKLIQDPSHHASTQTA